MINSAQIIHIADTVARDKSITREDVLLAMEMAIQKAGKAKYGQEHDIRAEIDRNNGNIKMLRYREVVEEIDPEEETRMLTVEQAQRYRPGIQAGEFIIDQLPPLDFGRIAAQSAKQVILQKVREAEREHQFEEFKDKIGEIVHGTVKRVEFGNIWVDLSGIAEGYLRRDELIQREVYRVGDRIRSLLFDVRRDSRGPQIMLSRTHPQFMAKLFAQEVPEVYEGHIEIRSVARDPGSRAKIVVYTADPTIDPVGSCVGMRGSRVQAVTSELQGEKVDIIPWSEDLATLVVRAMAPADVMKVVIDESKNKIQAIVPDEQLSQAIGRRGQNVRLAAQLLGLDIDIFTESQEAERRAEEFKARAEFFQRALDVDDVIGHLLVVEGFTTIEDIAYVDAEELAGIEGFDAAVASELMARANAFIEKEAAEYEAKKEELGFEEELVSETGLPQRMAIILAEKGVKTLDDLADLAADELEELVAPEHLTHEEAEAIIVAAREHWYAGEEAAESDDAFNESTTQQASA